MANCDDSCKCLVTATLRLIEFINEYQKTQILVLSALDYLAQDVTRVLSKEEMSDYGLYFLELYEQKIEEFNKEFQELKLEAAEALDRHRKLSAKRL